VPPPAGVSRPPLSTILYQAFADGKRKWRCAR
jgi:hypothetical protein